MATVEEKNSTGCMSASSRPALRTRKSVCVETPVLPAEENCVEQQISPRKRPKVTFDPSTGTATTSASSPPKSLVKLKPRGPLHPGKHSDGGGSPPNAAVSPEPPTTPRRRPAAPPVGGSPPGGKWRKAKRAAAVTPLPEGQEVTDTAGRKWRLGKQLSTPSPAGLLYQVFQTSQRNNESNHILKLGAKDGQIFNEQNFLQRAAKPASVERWLRRQQLSSLGLPSCSGFGTHGDSHRFLIFPHMGVSLRSILEEEEPLPAIDVLQLSIRILDVLEYVHSHEYVHADICADNVYIKPGEGSKVYLVGYGRSFRYCPNGHHVDYQRDSRTPHEGAVEFISLDAHQGAAPSRRGDLQALGYCMLSWHKGALPWSNLSDPSAVAQQKQRYLNDVPALLRLCCIHTHAYRAMEMYLLAVSSLEYSEQPDYHQLRETLRDVLQQLEGERERSRLSL